MNKRSQCKCKCHSSGPKHEEACCRPDTLNEICEDLTTRMDEKTLQEFKELPSKNIEGWHHSLGQFIRNTYGLWEIPWEPKLVNGVDYATDHPDAISTQVMRKLHKVLNKE